MSSVDRSNSAEHGALVLQAVEAADAASHENLKESLVTAINDYEREVRGVGCLSWFTNFSSAMKRARFFKAKLAQCRTHDDIIMSLAQMCRGKTASLAHRRLGSNKAKFLAIIFNVLRNDEAIKHKLRQRGIALDSDIDYANNQKELSAIFNKFSELYPKPCMGGYSYNGHKIKPFKPFIVDGEVYAAIDLVKPPAWKYFRRQRWKSSYKYHVKSGGEVTFHRVVKWDRKKQKWRSSNGKGVRISKADPIITPNYQREIQFYKMVYGVDSNNIPKRWSNDAYSGTMVRRYEHDLSSEFKTGVGRFISQPIEKRAEIFLALLKQVKRLHDKEQVHRDIKPENILVGSDGRLYLSDFGMSGRKGKDRFGGTRHYLPLDKRIVKKNKEGRRTNPMPYCYYDDIFALKRVFMMCFPECFKKGGGRCSSSQILRHVEAKKAKFGDGAAQFDFQEPSKHRNDDEFTLLNVWNSFEKNEIKGGDINIVIARFGEALGVHNEQDGEGEAKSSDGVVAVVADTNSVDELINAKVQLQQQIDLYLASYKPSSLFCGCWHNTNGRSNARELRANIVNAKTKNEILLALKNFCNGKQRGQRKRFSSVQCHDQSLISFVLNGCTKVLWLQAKLTLDNNVDYRIKSRDVRAARRRVFKRIKALNLPRRKGRRHKAR